jgi:hypothetical protein
VGIPRVTALVVDAALRGSGLSSRRRGMTSFANNVMFATVSLWSRKPPWPNINKWPNPPTLSLSPFFVNIIRGARKTGAALDQLLD